MLSFQKEPSQLPSQANETASSGNTNVPVKAPAGRADNNQEYLTVANRQGQLRQSTYLLAALFVIGVLCLFFMIKKSSPSTASASQPSAEKARQTQIEAAIAKITGVHSQVFSSLEKIVKKFYEFADFEQVDVGELSKNPFRKDNFLADIQADNKQIEPVVTQSEFELLTIMATEKGNCCMINDKLLYEGDTIRGLRVEKITDHSVSLTNDETQIVLRLSESF
jgi:preprotein translocase subunit SecG